jgi:hypothetical protein
MDKVHKPSDSEEHSSWLLDGYTTTDYTVLLWYKKRQVYLDLGHNSVEDEIIVKTSFSKWRKNFGDIFLFYNSILFAISTSKFSKLCKNLYNGT